MARAAELENAPPGYWLAQANVAYALAPHDDPKLAGFMARLDELNALAEQSPGFVWRYVTDSRDPEQREFEDPLVLFNFSVWTSIAALHAFTYRTAHAEVYAARKAWFADARGMLGGTTLALWWIPIGTLPTVAEAKARMARIDAEGPTPYAFTFKNPYFDPTNAP